MARKEESVAADASRSLKIQTDFQQRSRVRANRIAAGTFAQSFVGRPSVLISVAALAGVLLPSEMQISVAEGARFTAGRVAATLLFVPAVVALLRRQRRLIVCDFLVLLTSIWMIVAALSSAGTKALPTSGGEVLDFLGGYLIARAFIFGRPALDMFIRILKTFAVVAILLGLADNISGQLLTHNTIASLVNASDWPRGGMRRNMIRAASTFDHEILFGVFCALTAAILVYWEERKLRRMIAFAVCFLGCTLSLSSAAILAILMVLGAYTYDQLMRQSRWRWAAFWLLLGLFGSIVFLVSENPLAWIILHLTLDPQTGYFRFMIWDAALTYIGQAPLIGYAYELFHDNIIDGSVDSIWLLQSLRFGIPMTALFFLTNIAAIFSGGRQSSGINCDPYIERMQRAFTLALSIFMFTGLTVHFWNYMWMFWGICLGIRASLGELATASRYRKISPS